MRLRILLGLLFFLTIDFCIAQTVDRLNIVDGGGIRWDVKKGDVHSDHIEMGGEQIATVLRYGVNEKGGFELERSIVWPMLRTIPNDTRGFLMQRFANDVVSTLIVNGRSLQGEQVNSIALDGKMVVVSDYSNHAQITRTMFPSMKQPVFVEGFSLKNMSQKPMTVTVPNQRSVYTTDPKKGVDGSYTMVQGITNGGTYILQPNESVDFTASVQAFSKNQSEVAVDFATELGQRESFVNSMWENLVLTTPDDNINKAFAFAKIRASESIYKTKGGYMHGPGGESYYAAIWANDQAEYVNPLFPFLGYEVGNESARNSFAHFARFMNAEYKPIPSSIIAEGVDIWNGAGDRGDAAMIAYGASRYALALGDKALAKELWPLIEWCLEFSKSKTNSEGVVASDSDELENRFESGDANLCTSSLHYDALLSAIYLGKELGVDAKQLANYKKEADNLRKSIEKYFGANVEGFDTYQYYDGNTVLRSWICIPLTVGIYDRAEETIEALFSPRLWTQDGLLTEAGSVTFWDRSTLYALRGVYAAGKPDVATDYLKKYSQTRLLGEHVPYPIEAYPEGNQRHLSAESGLYARIITEGMFGIRPTGLNSFDLTPQLPTDWNNMSLSNIRAFGKEFSIAVNRIEGNKLNVIVSQNGAIIKKTQIKAGSTMSVKL